MHILPPNPGPTAPVHLYLRAALATALPLLSPALLLPAGGSLYKSLFGMDGTKDWRFRLLRGYKIFSNARRQLCCFT